MKRIFKTRILEHIFRIASPETRHGWAQSPSCAILHVGKIIRTCVFSVRLVAAALIIILACVGWSALWIGLPVILALILWIETFYLGHYKLSGFNRYPGLRKSFDELGDFYYENNLIWKVEIYEASFDKLICASIDHHQIEGKTSKVSQEEQVPARRL